MGLLDKLFSKKDPLDDLLEDEALPVASLAHETSDATPYAHELDAFMDRMFPGRSVVVWREKNMEAGRVDVCVMQPTAKEPYYVLYTSGMSAQEMTLDHLPYPEHYSYLRRAELLMYLPATWPMQTLFSAGENPVPESVYWPVRALKYLARMPQLCNTWLGAGHSVPNGDPMVPFEGAQGFSGMMLYFPDEGNGPKKLLPVPTDDGQIMLYVAVPVYAEEMNYKLAAGADALENRLRALPNAEAFIVTNGRKNTCQGGV